MTNRRRGRGEVHVFRPHLPGQLDDLLGCGAADDRVIYQQHVLAPELQVDGIELASHGCAPLSRAGHDEGPPDIAVLDEAFAVLDADFMGNLNGGGA